MAKRSAGLLMYWWGVGVLEVFLVHPGGPFWERKDEGFWSILKGEYELGENSLDVAKWEFQEETSFPALGEFIPLNPRKQPSGKIISAWALEGDCDASAIKSNTFSLEWPPRSGRQKEFSEVDRVGWFALATVREKIIKGQLGFLDELSQILTSEKVKRKE